MLERMTKDNDDWLDAKCVVCLKLLTSGSIGDYVVRSHVSPPLLVKSPPSSLYESSPGSLFHVQDQRNGILLLWLPLGWRENGLVIFDIGVKHVLNLSSVNICD
jgi:hypothetical protein